MIRDERKMYLKNKNFTKIFFFFLNDRTLQTTVHTSTMLAFMFVVARYHKFKSPNQSYVY